MKLTNKQLKQIIKEELEKVIMEMEDSGERRSYKVALSYPALEQAQEYLEVSDVKERQTGKYGEYPVVATIYGTEEEIDDTLSSESNERFPSGKPRGLDYSILEDGE